MTKKKYSDLMEKADWEAFQKNAVLRYKQLLIDKISLEGSLNLADKRLAEYPDEVEEAIEEALDDTVESNE